MRSFGHQGMDFDKLSHRRGDINAENRRAIHLLALAGIPLGIINCVAQLVILSPQRLLPQELFIVTWFVIVLAVESWFLPQDYPHATAALYLMQAPVMLLSLLLGTVWDPTHQAMTILLFLIVMPVFIMDRPARVMTWLSAWSLAFIIVCFLTKERSIFFVDTVHIVEFLIASSIVTSVVIRIRMSFLEKLEEVQYVLRHDRQTGSLSRYALEENSEHLIGKQLVLLLLDLDQLRLYRDFYGQSTADAMMLFFTKSTTQCFGENTTFRYGGDEILCTVYDSREGCLEQLERCRKMMAGFEFEGRRIPLSCGAGYVTGMAENTSQLRQMIQLADIYANKAKRTGQNRTEGGPFSMESLRQGIVDSNLYANAKNYEINQLTNLPDFSYFVARADEMLGKVADLERQPVLGYFKLMDMRDFNNEFGYAQGDELIADTARMLGRAFNGRHLCYVTGGEFCILSYLDEAERGFQTVQEELASYKPGIRVRCKLGLSHYREGQRCISLVDEAKVALNSIRESADRDLRFYDAELEEETRFSQYIIGHVDKAIEQGWLQVYYQPIARSVTGHVCNEEALSRWVDPKYGFLMPLRFIPILEENGLMYKVNLHVVQQVLRHLTRKAELGVPVVPISVNLSRRDFERCDMVEEITKLVDASGFPHSILKIEITESAFISDQEMLRREVDRFHERGFEVWLDDFGSEYSTLNLLQDLDFDLIKLDMRFMRNFRSGGKNYIIVSKTIEMAKQLGVDTLIEGVETMEHFRIMRRLGCDKIQGYLFNKPNPIDYVINRALGGTGLTFEKPESAQYYEAIGRVDLNEPLRSAREEGFAHNGEVPTGILELHGDELRCLRGNESFLRYLVRLGFLSSTEAENYAFNFLLESAPERLLAAAQRHRESDEWTSYETDAPEGESMTVYLRRISACAKQGTEALLTVVLPGRSGQ